MDAAQEFATLNRLTMAFDIIEKHFGLEPKELKFVHSMHNYFDAYDNTIRKGATPARDGEELIIPFNMATGSIIGIGKRK